MLSEQLMRDDIDVAMIYNPPNRVTIRVVSQVQKPTCLMVRKDHPLAKRSSIRLAECAPYPLVMPEYGTRAREVYDELLGKAAIDPTWIVTTSSYEMIRSMVRVGLGAAIVSDYLVKSDKTTDVAFVPLRDCAPSVLACCVRASRDLPPVASAFVSSASDFFATLK
jgi:DNA-binding transcriptional LysR family regulator